MQNTSSTEKDSQQSEKYEIKIFFNKAKQFYSTSSKQCAELYDIAYKRTDGFRQITVKTISGDPRIIKILRYMTVPTLSQMKLGQLLGIATTEQFEQSSDPSLQTKRELEKLSPKLSELFRKNLDKGRLIWQHTRLKANQEELARSYAKNWTCSLVANQNSATSFRNWRRDVQESKITTAILDSSYSQIQGRPTVRSVDDILVGQFCKETRVAGRTVQKADFVIRLKRSQRLLILEAKAIGVKIDAFKRIKECRDKQADWEGKFGKDVVTGVVLAGFVPSSQVQSLIDGGVMVFWEHRLKDLQNYLKGG